jgi:hypothetical protein
MPRCTSRDARLLFRATTSALIASVTPLHPPDDSAVDATRQRDRALSNSVAPPSEATVAVEAAVCLLRLLDPGLQ